VAGLIASSWEVLGTAGVFFQASNTLAKAMEKALEPAKLTSSQFVTLWVLLFSNEPMTPGQIARVLPRESHSVSASLDRLAERGLVKRRHSTQDRRKVEVVLTSEGESLLRLVSPNMYTVLTETFGQFSGDQLKFLGNIARQIRNTSVGLLGANSNHLEATLKRIEKQVETKK